MKAALAELVVEGVPTSASLHRRIMNNSHFSRGSVTTGFIEDHFSN